MHQYFIVFLPVYFASLVLLYCSLQCHSAFASNERIQRNRSYTLSYGLLKTIPTDNKELNEIIHIQITHLSCTYDYVVVCPSVSVIVCVHVCVGFFLKQLIVCYVHHHFASKVNVYEMHAHTVYIEI